jgi:hypothetical protein
VIAPTYGAFYTQSLSMVDLATGQTVTKGVSYIAIEMYEVPSAKFGKEVCSLILITDPAVSNNVAITYQAVGGEFTSSTEAILAQIAALNLDDRPVNWGSIIDKPSAYPPSHHLHDIGDVYGFEYMVHALERIRVAIEQGDTASHDEIYRYVDAAVAELEAGQGANDSTFFAHINNQQNPHGTTKAQVQLGNVENFPIASNQEALDGVANNRYMTPALVKASLSANLPDASDVVKGKVALNIGNTAGDDSNTTDALTSSGLINLVTATAANAMKNAFGVLLGNQGFLTQTSGDARYQQHLGFTPVRQGSGINQNTNTLHIGYRQATNKVLMTVDNTDFGPIATEAWASAYALPFSGGTLTGVLQGASAGLNPDAVGDGNNGSFICRASGGLLAGLTMWHDSYAIRMGVRADGIWTLGGWSRAGYSLYSDTAGNLVAAGNVTAYSDPRLKENQQPIRDALDKLLKLSGQHFTWKGGIAHTSNKAGKLDIGVMADEVEAVFPEIVTLSAEIDGEQYRTVAYDKLVPVVIEAIRILDDRYTTLAGRIGKIEDKLLTVG